MRWRQPASSGETRHPNGLSGSRPFKMLSGGRLRLQPPRLRLRLPTAQQQRRRRRHRHLARNGASLRKQRGCIDRRRARASRSAPPHRHLWRLSQHDRNGDTQALQHRTRVTAVRLPNQSAVAPLSPVAPAIQWIIQSTERFLASLATAVLPPTPPQDHPPPLPPPGPPPNSQNPHSSSAPHDPANTRHLRLPDG